MTKAEETSGRILFEEKQAFPRWLSLLLLSPVLLTVGLCIGLGYGGGKDRQELWIVLAIIVPMQLLMFYLFYRVKLEKVVTTNGLYYRWTPLQGKYRVIEKELLAAVELRRSPSLKYGSSYVLGYGRTHNLSNGKGMQLSLVTGRRIFFGTAEEAAFQQAVATLFSANPKNSPA